MKNLLPFIVSFFLPGTGQFILNEFKKGGIILLIYIISTFLVINIDSLKLIPYWFPHITIMIWTIFDVYVIIEKQDGKKSATRYLVFSILIVVVLFPLTLYVFAAGMLKGVEFIKDEYVNEESTKREMNRIVIELNDYKEYYGVFPENYTSFVRRKPIWSGWNADDWGKPYKYELIDPVNYKLISAGKDGVFDNGDDIIRTN